MKVDDYADASSAQEYLFPVAAGGVIEPITDMSIYFSDSGPALPFSFAILNGDYLFSTQAKTDKDCLHLVADKLTLHLLNLYLFYEEEDLKATLRHKNFEISFHFSDQPQLVGFVKRVERWVVGCDLSRFELVRDVDKGSFGAVKLMKDRLKGDKLVTLKTVTVPTKPAREGLKALLNEVAILRKVRHPNVLKLYSVLHIQDQINLITEYISGGTLEGIIQTGGLGVVEAMDVTRALLLAVRETHSHKFVHRDIKPTNVMWKQPQNKSKKWKLIDFGLSEDYTDFSESSLMRDRTGTVCYMAPEILDPELTGGAYTQAVDLYSVGIVLFEL
jgi:hypothetical protein